MKRIAALLALLLIAGCSAKSPPAPSTPAPVKASDAAPVQAAPAATVNDGAFALIKQQRWPEAIAAAQKAVAANENDSAAHFNLGRAYLGAGQAAHAAAAFERASQLTGGANADVEYFRGQALVANQQLKEAAQVWTGALAGPLHGDKEIAAELQKVLGNLDLAVAVGDVNADGKPDLLQVNAERLTITSGTGERLYDGDLPPKSLKEITHRIRLYPLSTGAPLIHVEIPTCPSAPLNALFWYDGKQIVTVGEGKGPCTVFAAKGNDTFQDGYRAAPLYHMSQMRFENGAFKAVGSSVALMWAPPKAQIGYVLTEIVHASLDNPEELFATMAVYAEFRNKTAAAGHWEFQQGGEVTADSVQVKPVHDGKTLGIATVYLQKADSGVKITRIVWP